MADRRSQQELGGATSTRRPSIWKLEVGPSDTETPAPAFQKIQDRLQRTQGKETRLRKRILAAPLRESRGEGFVVRVRPNQDGIEMEAGGLGPEGPGPLVPAWKGEVVHPGAPESQCVYRALFNRILSVLSL
jgi:hypothetical protein